MPIFTIEVSGHGVMAFSAPNLESAKAELEDDDAGILDGLLNVTNPDGTMLFIDENLVHVREASEEERGKWYEVVAMAVQEGSLKDPHQAISEGFVAYLVPVTAAYDE